MQEFPHTQILRSGRHHLHLHHHLLQTRYLLTGTRRNVNFFTTRLHGPLRCARTSSDRLSPPVRAKVRSWRLGWDALKDVIVALAHAYSSTYKLRRSVSLLSPLDYCFDGTVSSHVLLSFELVKV